MEAAIVIKVTTRLPSFLDFAVAAFGRARSQMLRSNSASKNPHEEELHNVGVEKEELRPLIALRTRVGLHRAAGIAG